MKNSILIVLFFLFYFITLKDLYDHNKFLMEDVKIMELESYEQDSIINKLRKDNYLLIKKLDELKIEKKKPIKIRKIRVMDTPKVEPIILEQDSLVKQI